MLEGRENELAAQVAKLAEELDSEFVRKDEFDEVRMVAEELRNELEGLPKQNFSGDIRPIGGLMSNDSP